MVDFFDRLYSSIIIKNHYLEKIKYYSISRFVVRLFANIIIPFYFKLSNNNSAYKIKESVKTKKRVIVSLTSFPTRINKVWLVIESILRQSHKPDKIILWLSKEQFSSLDSLPKNLTSLKKRGLQIRLCDDDLRSHKKYYYAFKEFPDDIVITIDDDIIYSPKLLTNLILLNNNFPESICCNHASEILIEAEQLCSYDKWNNVDIKVTNTNKLMPIGVGGVLYPPNSLIDRVFDIDVFSNYCFLADDIWLNIMARLKKTKVSKSSYKSHYLPIMYKSNKTLNYRNIDEGMNDKQLIRTRKYCIDTWGTDPYIDLIKNK